MREIRGRKIKGRDKREIRGLEGRKGEDGKREGSELSMIMMKIRRFIMWLWIHSIKMQLTLWDMT